MNKTIQTVPIPNLSIVLPGECNVGCKFCTWNSNDHVNLRVHDQYLDRVKYILDTIPEHFISISLTGGEPLLSPYLWPVLDIIDKTRWQRVGLTTNGTHLTTDILDRFSEKLDFLNISRHHYDDNINREIFGSDSIPSTTDLMELNRHSYSLGLPVSYNCVLTKYLLPTKQEIEKFIKFTFKTNSVHVSFRKIQGPKTTTAPSKHELLYLDDPTYHNNPCPVCRTADTKILNMWVSWKAAVLEPSVHLGYWFEGVIHPTGILSGDWNGKMIGEPDCLEIIEDNYDYDEMVSIKRSELKSLLQFIKDKHD